MAALQDKTALVTGASRGIGHIVVRNISCCRPSMDGCQVTAYGAVSKENEIVTSAQVGPRQSKRVIKKP